MLCGHANFITAKLGERRFDHNGASEMIEQRRVSKVQNFCHKRRTSSFFIVYLIFLQKILDVRLRLFGCRWHLFASGGDLSCARYVVAEAARTIQISP